MDEIRFMDQKVSIKTNLEDLAIFSGKPAFSEKLHVGRPNLGDRIPGIDIR
jgi:hypothetical protein